MVNQGVKLPDGYVKLNYVEATGQQYIKTDYTPRNTTPQKIVADFQFTAVTTQTHQTLFGKSNNVSNFGTFWFTVTSNGQYGFARSAMTQSSGQPTSTTKFGSADLDRHRFMFVYKTGVFIDGTMYPELTEQSSYNNWHTYTNPGNEFALFANQRGGVIDSTRYAHARLYDFRIYEDTGLVRRFVPAQKEDTGEIGMYEICEGIFYTSGTSTPFIGG